jgi:hypothetical protein
MRGLPNKRMKLTRGEGARALIKRRAQLIRGVMPSERGVSDEQATT